MDAKNEQKELDRKMLISLLFLLVGIICVCTAKFYFQPQYQELQEGIGATASIARNIASVETQKGNYEAMLEESGKTYGNLATEKDQYIYYVGEIAMANKLNINKMTVDDIVPAGNQMYTMKVQIELQGDLYNVKNLVQQLYDSEMVSRINSFSYRLQSDKDLLWMWREIDDQTLVPWWSLEEAKEQPKAPEGEEEAPLNANDLLEHGTALCYLEVEFLGTGG